MTINIPRMGKAKWKLGVYNMRKIAFRWTGLGNSPVPNS